jgi:predicted DNA-binding transcriptional regulator
MKEKLKWRNVKWGFQCKERSMRWARHVACLARRGIYAEVFQENLKNRDN